MKKVCISLKELYENGHEHLANGGYIVKSSGGGKDFYDLYSDGYDSGILICCDGEECNVVEQVVSIVILENVNTGKRIWLQTTEYDLAVFG